jgi:c-di-GMP-related signal transduction protein
MELFVARQPIFDARMHVVAYEMLFRSGRVDAYDGTDENEATSKVINALFDCAESESLRAGKPAFINFPRGLLLNETGLVLPRDHVVIEILETVEPDGEVVSAVRHLRDRGYRLALDDFVPNGSPHPLVPVVDVLKVDFRAATQQQQACAAKQRRGNLALLAEKVETREEFERASRLGYTLFQGYFFARPEISTSRQIRGFKLNYLRILEEIHHHELDMAKLAELLKREHGLAYKMLRFVNSALFPRHEPIDSIRQALGYIGEDAARKWLSVVALANLASDKPAELAVNTLLRARFAELLALDAGLALLAEDCFLMGLFSRLDAMLGRPLEELLAGLNLNGEIVRSLLGNALPDDRMPALWDLVRVYEVAGWDEIMPLATGLKVTAESVAAAYAKAVVWADTASVA